ncbi:MAG: peptidoglycan D,D-transpeptidase FtsI family protein [Alphaproteobacteria bacterium]
MAASENIRLAALETARTRLLVGGAVFAACFLVVGLRLADLGVINQEQDTRTRLHREIAGPIETQRSDIVDRQGELLATNLVTASLFANPRRVLDPAKAARNLAPLLPEFSEAELAATLSTDRKFVWLKRNLTPRQQFEFNRLGIPGLDFERAERRVYPHGALAAHVVGFTGIDNEGLSGIEKSFDAKLAAGKDQLQLSIDLRVQHILRKTLSAQIEKFSALGGGGVIMDVETGEIMALVSLPDFDPNNPRDAIADARFNRISLGVYELGSVFKIFNHAMALESGAATLRDGYDASKSIRVSRFTISDYHGENRWLSLPEIFKFSSNVGSAKMALDVGSKAQREFLGTLGLLARTTIELPELGRPIFPTAAAWREVSTMTIAYGHGIAVSPLQLAAATAAMVNGGLLLPPTLINRSPSDPVVGKRVISPTTSDSMRRLMRLVVEDGTGRNAAAPGYVVGGKTGTADKPLDGRYAKKAVISSFAAVFPANAPRYVVVVMLDEPKGIKESFGFATAGWTAAPVVAQVITQAAPILGVSPVDEEATEIKSALALSLYSRDRAVAAN